MRVFTIGMAAALGWAGGLAHAQAQGGASADELAKQLANPVSSLISVPLQSNFDFDGGPAGDGFKYTLNMQPVVPISLSEDWNLISRTIVPVIYQDDVVNDDGDWEQFGLGDILESAFFSPAEPGPHGVIWGVGPAALLPTATEEVLGAEQFGLGPTAVALVQEGPWTYGGLANHIWSVAGEDDRADVSATFLQPFLIRGFPGGVTVAVNAEATYDWESENWLVPVNLMYNKVFRWGGQMLQGQAGARAFAEAPDGAPDWGLRAALILLFPK